MTLVIISIEAWCLMARCLKGECTPEEKRALADLLATNPDLRQEYETFKNYFSHTEDPAQRSENTSTLQQKFAGITKKLKDEGFL